MNFLLHRHLAARDLGSAEAGLGAMLPDLWRMVDRRVRARSLDGLDDAHTPRRDLLAGVDHHLAVDRWFHRDALFADGEREAVRRLQQANVSARRITLFGHMLWEMCLDGALVRRESAPRIASEIRDGLHRGEAVLGDCADLHHFSRVTRTPTERSTFDARLLRICRELATGAWIDGYNAGDRLAARVEQMRVRVGLEPMTTGDEARVADVANALLGVAVEAVDRIVATSTFTAWPTPSARTPRHANGERALPVSSRTNIAGTRSPAE
jgi:hypothetical protein